MCLWVPVGFVLRDDWSCRTTWNISGKAAATVHFAPPVPLIPIRSAVAAETAGVREGPISICLFLLSLPHHISRVMGLKIMYNRVMEMCSLEENLRQFFFKALDSPVLDSTNIAFAFWNSSSGGTKAWKFWSPPFVCLPLMHEKRWRAFSSPF